MYDERTIPGGGSSTGVAFGPDAALFRHGLDERPERSQQIWKIGRSGKTTLPANGQPALGRRHGRKRSLFGCLPSRPIQESQAAQFEMVRRKKTWALLVVANKLKTNWPASPQSGE